jgi:flagellar basal-body rod protein FlgC
MINLLSGIDSTSAALNAERIRMDVISQNIANANVARGVDGKPFQRQQVLFETVLNAQSPHIGGPGLGPHGVQVARIEKDPRPPRLIHNPHHPQADRATGMVSLPDINTYEEMADYIASSRAFEANLAVVKNARSMALQTLSIGKR